MGERSDEETATREQPSTDELLAETDRLLEDVGGGAAAEPRESRGDESGLEPDAASPETEPGATPSADAESSSSRWWPAGESDDASETATAGSGRLARFAPTRYFSPTAFLALVALFGAGLVAGSVLLPAVARLLGMFVVAFLVGSVASKRRYLEVTAAGASVGIVSSLLNHAVLSIAGAGQRVAAIGAAAGIVTCLVGYYFGRDLRDGLSREI